MFSHMMVGSDDLDRSKRFYDALFTAVGGRAGGFDPAGRVVYLHNGAVFLVTRPIDGGPATVGNGATIGFTMDSPEQADAWHRAGVAAGGRGDRGAAGRAQGLGHDPLPRLPPRPGRQQALRPPPRAVAGVTRPARRRSAGSSQTRLPPFIRRAIGCTP